MQMSVILLMAVDDKDLLSLFLWLADNGYMTISDGRDKKDTTFAKLKELNGSEPMYVKIIFQALFSGSNTSKVSDLKGFLLLTVWQQLKLN